MKELDHVTIHHVKLREHCDNGARSLKAAVHGLHRSRSHGCRGQASISIVLLDCSEGGAIQVPTLICPAFGVCGQRERQRGQILLREGKEKRRREKKNKNKKKKKKNKQRHCNLDYFGSDGCSESSSRDLKAQRARNTWPTRAYPAASSRSQAQASLPQALRRSRSEAR